LPGLLPAPWRLDYQASQETLPYLAEPSRDPDARLWARAATLVYRAASKPDRSPAVVLKDAPSVESYWLSGVR
jgi:hypothetical protein